MILSILIDAGNRHGLNVSAMLKDASWESTNVLTLAKYLKSLRELFEMLIVFSGKV
jgi:hypothetical protein